MYSVRLPVFEGPFDLLLHLIEREKLDISTVSLAMVTDQFLAFVAEMETIQAADLADFLVMASRLLLIKSRLLLPREPAADDEEEEDPGEALARQLREYKRFKEIAAALRMIEEGGHHTYTRAAPPPQMERRLSPHEFSLDDLLAAASAALVSAPPQPLPAGVVVPFTLTIQDQIRLIRRATSGGQPVTFRALVQGAQYRMEIAVTLLAVLELIKRRQVTAMQRGLFGEIEIVPVPGTEISVEEEVGENGAGQQEDVAS